MSLHPLSQVHRLVQMPTPDYWDEYEAIQEHLLDNYALILTEEATGKVSETVIVNTLLAAWQLQRMRTRIHDSNILNILDVQIPILARKYHFTKLLHTGSIWTLQRRVKKQFPDDAVNVERYRCARCGRELSAELSIKRGRGPVCYRKVDS